MTLAPDTVDSPDQCCEGIVKVLPKNKYSKLTEQTRRSTNRGRGEAGREERRKGAKGVALKGKEKEKKNNLLLGKA